MFYLTLIIPLLILSIGNGLAQNSGINLKTNIITNQDSVSYVIGVNVGRNIITGLTRDAIDYSIPALIMGFKDAILGIDSMVLTEMEKAAIMDVFQKDLEKKYRERIAIAAKPNKEKGARWLANNKVKPGVIQTASGLQYKVIKMGTGVRPKPNDSVMVNFEGMFLDRTIFDSSYKRSKPDTFSLSHIIPGWLEGLQLMREGSIFELYIPSDLAYGDEGSPPNIPGGSLLIFKVELLKVIAGTN